MVPIKFIFAFACLFLTGCAMQAVVFLHNQSNQPIQLIADKEYAVQPNGVISFQPPLDQVISIKTRTGDRLNYYVIFPYPHDAYLKTTGDTVVCEMAFLEDHLLYVLKPGQTTFSASDLQPNGFPLKPTEIGKGN